MATAFQPTPSGTVQAGSGMTTVSDADLQAAYEYWRSRPDATNVPERLALITQELERRGIETSTPEGTPLNTIQDYLAELTRLQGTNNDTEYRRIRQEAERKFGDQATAAFSEGGFMPGLNMTSVESATWESEQALTRARGTQEGLLESIRGLGPAISQEELNRLITRGRDVGTRGLARSQEQLRESAAGRGLGDSGALLSSQQSAFDRLIREQASSEAMERDLARQQNLAFEASKIGMGEDALTRLMELDLNRDFIVSDTGGTVQGNIGSPTVAPAPIAAPVGAPRTDVDLLAERSSTAPIAPLSTAPTAIAPATTNLSPTRTPIAKGTLNLRRTAFTAGNTVKA